MQPAKRKREETLAAGKAGKAEEKAAGAAAPPKQKKKKEIHVPVPRQQVNISIWCQTLKKKTDGFLQVEMAVNALFSYMKKQRAAIGSERDLLADDNDRGDEFLFITIGLKRTPDRTRNKPVPV